MKNNKKTIGLQLCRALSLFIFILIVGCAALPKTNDLQTLHNIYKREFAQIVLDSKFEGNGALSENVKGFPETQDQIRVLQVKYTNDSEVKAHLTILNGMTYLQAKQFGLAKTQINNVEKAGEELKRVSANPSVVRDRLFASVYKSLIMGWEAFEAENTVDLVKSFNDISAKLQQANNEKAREYADEGSIYLAATAALFLQRVAAKTSDENIRNELYNSAATLLSDYLTDEEKTIVDAYFYDSAEIVAEGPNIHSNVSIKTEDKKDIKETLQESMKRSNRRLRYVHLYYNLKAQTQSTQQATSIY